MKPQEYKYFAFISYNSLDYKWGKRIQKKLERYRMPATLCSKHGWKKNPMRPVFLLLPTYSQEVCHLNCKND